MTADDHDQPRISLGERRTIVRGLVVFFIDVVIITLVAVDEVVTRLPASGQRNVFAVLAVVSLVAWVDWMMARDRAQREARFDRIEELHAEAIELWRAIKQMNIHLDDLRDDTGGIAIGVGRQAAQDEVARLEIRKLSERLDQSDHDRDQLVATVLDTLKVMHQMDRSPDGGDQ